MMELLPVIVEIILFIALMYTYYVVSVSDKVSTFYKWIIILSSVGILAIADKVKLLMFIITVTILWLFKYHKKQSNDRLA